MKCVICSKSFQPKLTLKMLVLGKQLDLQLCCTTCLMTFSKINPEESSRCPTCLKKLKQTNCDDCIYWQSIYPHLSSHHALFDYNRSMQKYMKAFKFDGNIRLSSAFKTEIAAYFDTISYDIVVPVPLSSKRLKARGFNQVEELLKASNVSYNDLLTKNKHTKQQSKCNREQRLLSQHGFEVKRHKDKYLKGKRVVLVDDVYTTGSTIYQAKSVITEAGAKEVMTLTLAR